jgi:multiple antibiotic resistance protein
MLSSDTLIAFLKCSLTLFIIMDPFFSAAFFVGFAKNSTDKQRQKAIWTALSVAGALLFIFLFTGLSILKVLNISFSGFKIAGGLILLVLGASMVLGVDIGGAKRENMKSAAILIGTPLLAGPGTLATAIVLSKDYGYIIPAISGVIILALSYVILKFAFKLNDLVGREVIEILSKVLGLLLAALAVDYVYSGVLGLISGAI